MKKIVVFSWFLFLVVATQAQQQSFDIVTYTAPKNWKVESADSYQMYSKIDGSSWAQIAVYKSTASKGSVEADSESEWKALVAGSKSVTQEEQAKPTSAEGWQVMSRSGVWVYDGANVATILTTYSNNKVCVSVLCNATAKPYLSDYQSLIASIRLKENANSTASASENTGKSVEGIWGKYTNEMTAMQTTTGGYFQKEYRLNSDGTYLFFEKNFSVYNPIIIFSTETGNWSVAGNKITITPIKGKNEQWSKSADNSIYKWGKLQKTTNRKLEKVTYSFSMTYLSGMEKNYLDLSAAAATERDGRSSGSSKALQSFRYSEYKKGEALFDDSNDLPPGFVMPVQRSSVVNDNVKGTSHTNTASSSSGKTRGTLTGLWTNYSLETTGVTMNGMPQYTAGYLRKEYDFKTDGTYVFRNKQWLAKAKDILFVYEEGRYEVTDKQLILTPTKGKSGFWEKKASSTEWGKLVSYNDYKLEKVAYTLEVIEDPNYSNTIELRPGQATQRDGGKFNAADDPYVFRYSFRKLQSLIDNPPGFATGF